MGPSDSTIPILETENCEETMSDFDTVGEVSEDEEKASECSSANAEVPPSNNKSDVESDINVPTPGKNVSKRSKRQIKPPKRFGEWTK